MAAAAERGAGLPAEPPPPPPRGVRPPPLGPEEVARRLAVTRRELSNRRKILLRNLPAESSSQEIHDLFKDYEIKYCYVDRNKRTAFVTLLNGEQAQNAIQKFHQYSLRGKEISVQLQPTDALLCITNLPILFTLEEFEELVRAYGNVERCFLVYNEVTGHSKGYGFVEYMKKDSAAKARLELLGKQLDESTLFAQWMDVNQLTTNLIHSKCLCVDKLQKDFSDSKELLQAFSLQYKPVFCQFAQDEDSCIGDFAVIEYETAEQAEKVQEAMDGTVIKGRRVQVSYCAPGAPGRSTLAALIAAQRMVRNNRKGLLPEPNPVQIMKSFNNPAMLQILLQPQLRGHARVLIYSIISQPPSKKQTSLLGEPPKEIRLSTNPYLNLASVLPGICLPGKQTFSSCIGKFPQPECGKSFYCRWDTLTYSALKKSKRAPGAPLAMCFMGWRWPERGQEAAASQHASRSVGTSPASPLPSQTCMRSRAPVHLRSVFRERAQPLTHKRGSSYLIASPEPGPVEYLGQHAQGSAVRYAESSLKKKRVY
uniref:Ribonucleoprotein PTB-binding 1 n=1 Tax=Pavo cristatus TaxID=9049 RepID=A0A8C9L8Y5_PAVCR